MKLPIILIGPICVGKSTIASILTKKLLIRHFPLDMLEAYYGPKNGMDFDKEDEMVKGDDFGAYVTYHQPYDIATIEGVVKESEFLKGIIHFGATHSYYEEESMLNRAKNALKDISNIILLLPSEDLKESSNILRGRLIEREKAEKTSSKKLETMLLMNDKFINAKSNFELSKIIIYTEGKNPEMVADEIIKKSG